MRIVKPGSWIAAALLACGVASAGAHEFWVAPQRASVEPGAHVVAALRVGRMMRGTELPYLSSGFRSLTVTTRDGTRDIVGNEGDIPALSYVAKSAGLHTIAYHSTAKLATFDEWEKFLKYLANEGLDEIATTHRARGLPRSGFKEAYTRSAKALVQVGAVDGQDRDRASGHPFEMVAEGNPYTPGLKTMTVRLLRNGSPVAGRQIAVFRDDGAVTRTLVRTDALGMASVPIARGGSFLLSATDLQPIDNAEFVWQSHWASLTFALPVLLPKHPLDPLLKIEITRAIDVIGQSGRVDPNIPSVLALATLAEPDKAEVLAWRPGAAPNRRAFVVIRTGPDVFEAIVNLQAGVLEQWRQVTGVQPAISSNEWSRAQALTKADPRWLAAMRARGYDDVSQIFCASLTVGYFGRAAERERRLLQMPCYDIKDNRSNIYGRPLEGLIAVVDLHADKVLRIIDSGPVPVSKQSHELDARPPRAASDSPTRDEGPTVRRDFSIDERLINWHAWSFHVGFDPRFGTVLSLVTHADGARKRSVLYQGHLSEVFVPYMDADEGWYNRSYMDVGEYGLGRLSSPLQPGTDCPDNAAYFDAELSKPMGELYTRARAICVFERDVGAPLWRHWEALNGAYAGQAASELVVRSMPSIGNYDYVVDWVFTRKGELHINVGATGIDAVKGVAVTNMNEPSAPAATRSGMLVAPNLLAVHHDHYFSFRLDLDVDGPINSFVRERLTPRALAEGEPRRSLWELVSVPMTGEGALSAREGPELWRIENPALQTSLGHRPSFQLEGSSNATSLMSADDWPQKRAAFSAQTLWITARRPGELFAAGAYPNQSPGGAGLSEYVNGERVTEADVVAWYTMGFHHLTRPEDWPVLPTIWHSLRLRPYGFFTRNPSQRTPAIHEPRK